MICGLDKVIRLPVGAHLPTAEILYGGVYRRLTRLQGCNFVRCGVIFTSRFLEKGLLSVILITNSIELSYTEASLLKFKVV